MVLNEAQQQALGGWLALAIGADAVEISCCERLGGGAIQENVALDVSVQGGPRAGLHALVLRTDAPSAVAESRSRIEEFEILRVAHGAGVKVPEPWAACPDPGVLGRPFAVMGRVAGEARGVRLVRDPEVIARGDAIVAEVAAELAKLHRIAPEPSLLPFVRVPQGPTHLARIADLRRGFDRLAEAQPVFEWGLRWLELGMPAALELRLVHADCRTGNVMVEAGGVTAILDWEFARFSDPLEDLGWFLARCWRFGAVNRHAGGIGSREAFLAAYEAARGRPVPRSVLPYWELFATIRWGMIAIMQAQRHYTGGERSLELALTAHVVPVLEREVLAYVEAIERGETR
jgi:aminoglycoside phosphotransferase (APT) family kinase protein